MKNTWYFRHTWTSIISIHQSKDYHFLFVFPVLYVNLAVYIAYACIVDCFYYTWLLSMPETHDDVIKWKHFPHYWPFVRGIHRSPVSSPRKGQWRGTLMSSLICARINCWVNNRKAGDLRRHSAHYDVIVMMNKSKLPIVLVVASIMGRFVVYWFY